MTLHHRKKISLRLLSSRIARSSYRRHGHRLAALRWLITGGILFVLSRCRINVLALACRHLRNARDMHLLRGKLLPINFLVDQEVVHRRHSPSCIDLYSDWPILILICCNETFDAETVRFTDVIDPQKVSSDTMKCPAYLIGPAVMYRTLGSPINSGSSGRSSRQPHPPQHLHPVQHVPLATVEPASTVFVDYI